MPLQDLNQMFSIVKPDGTPTDYFMRLLRDRKDSSQTVEEQVSGLTSEVAALTTLVASKADKSITLTAGSGLAGGGDLSANRAFSLNAGIDLLTDVDTTTTPPTGGQALAWDAGSSLWKPTTISGGGGGNTEFAVNNPSASGYTVYAGTASGSVQSTSVGLELFVAQGGGQRGVALTKSLPSTPFTMTVRFNSMALYNAEMIQGLCVRNASGALVTFYQYTDGRFYLQRWSDQSSFSANVANGNTFFPAMPIPRYYALSIDGSGVITAFFSNNGIRFFPFATENVSTFLGTATSIGMHLAVDNSAGNQGSMHIPYIRFESGVTTPSSIF